jgi:hypothetical protein
VGLYDPFGHLKHKLWPKEGPRVKLTIWLPTIKIQESTQFPCVQVLCDISLESSRRGLQLCFRPHLNQRSINKVMGPQSCESLDFGNFRDSHIGIPGQNAIWMWASWRGTEYTIRGKVMASPKSGPWWVLWVQVCLWLVLTPKVLQQGTNQFVIWFCAGPCEWVSACHSS